MSARAVWRLVTAIAAVLLLSWGARLSTQGHGWGIVLGMVGAFVVGILARERDS